MAWIDAASEELLALDVALDELEIIDQRKVRVLELRFFLGCTNEEAAEFLNISRATVDRDLEFSKDGYTGDCLQPADRGTREFSGFAGRLAQQWFQVQIADQSVQVVGM